MPTKPDWCFDDKSKYSIKLIPNGDNEAFLNILPFRGNLTVSTESGWRGISMKNSLLSFSFLSCDLITCNEKDSTC